MKSRKLFLNGPYIIADNVSGTIVHTTTCLGLRIAEVLPEGMTLGMSKIGLPHSSHTELCVEVDAETHKIVHHCRLNDSCCHLAIANYIDV